MTHSIKSQDFTDMGLNAVLVEIECDDSELDAAMTEFMLEVRKRLKIASLGRFAAEVMFEIRRTITPSTTLDVRDKEDGGKQYTVGMSEAVDVKVVGGPG